MSIKTFFILISLVLTPLFFNSSFADAATLRTAPTNGLVGYWSMDSGTINGTKVRNLTNMGGNGTIVGGVTAVKGKLNEGLAFDGSTGYVTMGDAAILRFEQNNSFTLSAWVKSGSANGYILSKESSAAGVPGYHMATGGSSPFTCWIINNTVTDKYSYREANTNGANDGKWHQLTCTYNGNGAGTGLTLYMDGVVVPSTVQHETLAGNSIANSASFNIGARNNANVFFLGSIDDARVYNRALSSAEVKQVYQAGGVSKVNASQVYGPPTPTTNLQSGLVGMWDFGASKMGTTSALDASGNNSTGWLIGGVKKVIGKVGQGLQFNRTYVQVPSITAITTSLTQCTWFKRQPGNKIMLGKYGTVGNYGYELEVYTDNKMYFTVSGDGTNVQYFTSTDTTVDRGWNHFCGVYNGATLVVYLNGALIPGSITGIVPASLFNTTQPFEIGRASGDNNYVATGLMDEVRVYNRALSQAEVTALYRAGR